MEYAILIGLNLILITILSCAIYYRRHLRRDLVVAFIGINIGVMAVSIILASAGTALGIGLGLFGVLSIIRLRSDEISQREVAYYFASLALGLIAGIHASNILLNASLMILIVLVMFIADSPKIKGKDIVQNIRLDTAVTAHEAKSILEDKLHISNIHTINVTNIDYVNDTTQAEIRYRSDNQ